MFSTIFLLKGIKSSPSWSYNNVLEEKKIQYIMSFLH